jgi:predicted nucleic acid-binding protein
VRVFLDANVLFSASNPGSAFSRLVSVALEHADAVLTSDLACAEARRNLALKRPAWLATFAAMLEPLGPDGGPGLEMVPSAFFPLPVELADKDIPLLCAAIGARSDYFVTGDRKDFGHLLDLVVKGVTVITPKQLALMLHELSSGSEEAS